MSIVEPRVPWETLLAQARADLKSKYPAFPGRSPRDPDNWVPEKWVISEALRLDYRDDQRPHYKRELEELAGRSHQWRTCCEDNPECPFPGEFWCINDDCQANHADGHDQPCPYRMEDS